MWGVGVTAGATPGPAAAAATTALPAGVSGVLGGGKEAEGEEEKSGRVKNK